MDIDSVDRVGVVGAGTMGSGIAQVAATAGFDVVLRDLDQSLVEDGLARIGEGLEAGVEHDSLTDDDADTARERVTGTTALEELSTVDLVVEAVVESMDVKQEVFADLDAVCPPETIFGSNTSTLSITEMAAATDRPELVVGLHFMNPVPRMKGVEVVDGEHTSEATLSLAHDFAAALGKETWESADTPGFVSNRILMPWINEGIRAYDEGVATREDVDRGMKLGTNVPMGPLELADHVGLDVVLDASETLHRELGERFRPAYLLKRKVAAGDLGKKTGKGFYEYE